ncbi:MAG: hypothetical protein PHV37_04890 [Candidatus Gastranaerophilales bacterium]|nr:hypothetical protein [Candidatus Gastranaerophilales bacterium]
MQHDEKILAKAIAKVMVDISNKSGKSLNLFCNEYSIPASTLSNIELAKKSGKIFSLYKILKAYGISPSKFFAAVEKELPSDFLSPED